MNLSEQEKEELFADFAVRMAEMDKADKRISVTKNNAAMTDLTTYYNENIGRYAGGKTKENEWLYRQDESGWWYFSADGLYSAYLTLRKAIPYIIGAKRALNGEHIPRGQYNRDYVLDKEKDKEMVNEIGKRLIDTMLGYLKEENKNEAL